MEITRCAFKKNTPTCIAARVQAANGGEKSAGGCQVRNTIYLLGI
jgi:hypothetical protein